MKRLTLFCLILCAIPLTLYAGASEQSSRDFWHPKYHGKPLAYCTLDQSKCGKPIADRYCQMLGYERAKTELIQYNRGLTNYLLTRASCKGWTCDSFKLISCIKSLKQQPPKSYHYQKKRFAYPRVNQYRVDWCNDKNKNCGRVPALAFCRYQGYMRAINYQRDQQVHASQHFGSGELCFGKSCQGFSYIDCKR